jgi:hypothetical protein
MKAHMLNTDEAAREGESQTAICGVEVPKAAFVFFFDGNSKFGAEFFLTLNQISTCAKCLQGDFPKRYIYGILNGQESRDRAA